MLVSLKAHSISASKNLALLMDRGSAEDTIENQEDVSRMLAGSTTKG